MALKYDGTDVPSVRKMFKDINTDGGWHWPIGGTACQWLRHLQTQSRRAGLGHWIG